MEEVGHTVSLEVLKSTPQGMYLVNHENQEVLLPNKYVAGDLEIGDKIEVFVYRDSEDRPVATTIAPYIKLNTCAFLTVVDVNKYGAFFDWGMEKDLLVPFSEQHLQLTKGKRYLVYLYKDELTNRLVGTTKLGKFIRSNKLSVKAGDKVSFLVSGEVDLGYKVIVENKHYGMVFKNELFRSVSVGDRLEGYVQRVRKDNKLDITLNSAKLGDTETLANVIFERLLKEKGTFPLSDKSDPESIYAAFQVSKKAFRRAIGLLYKERKIKIYPEHIELLN